MKFRFLLSLIGLVVTLGACSTISDRQTYSYPMPPKSMADIWGRDPLQLDQQLENRHLADPSNQPLTLLVRYQQAKVWLTRDPAKSCALWLEVLGEPRFPLAKIARLHAMGVCANDTEKFPSIDDLMAAPAEPWLDDLLTRSLLARAQRLGNKAWDMRLSFKVAQLEKLQSEKIRALQRAQKLAQELNDAEDADAAENKIEALAPRFIQNPSDDLILKAAADFKQARAFDQARKLYQKVVDSEKFNSFDKLKALDGIRMTYKLEKKTEAFLESSERYSSFAKRQLLKKGRERLQAGDSEGRALIAKYFETRLALARAVWTEGRPSEAQAILKSSENDVRGLIPIHDSILIRSRIEEEAGRFERTVSLLNEIDTSKIQNVDTRMKILWYRAWNLRKAGHLKESAEALANLIPQESATASAARDRFWYARTLREIGETDKANQEFQALIDTDALSWYALLAYRELKQPIPTLAPGSITIRGPASTKAGQTALTAEEKLTFEWLLAAGENDLAEKFLDQVTSDRRASFNEDQTKDLLQEYARAGQFQALFTRLYELPAEQRKNLLATDPGLLFPQPWNALVKTAGDKFGVQTELIYSIMRQESSFNPFARSAADAFGLMQLIPEMAQKAELTAGIQISDHEDLYRPETNIPLGTAFVHDLLERWHGGFIPTVASYNASEKAITGWVKSRYRGDPLVFIEDVPYEETRNYIKLVMRNFIFYKRLNSGGAPVPFPEWCLANLQDVKP